MSQLTDDQLSDFDVEYVTDSRWPPILEGLASLPADFSFLDVGGGNGLFADRVLDHFPLASGVVGDNAEILLERNVAHARKRTIVLDALALPEAGLDRVDVVFLNWVLHHLVVTGDYARSRRNIARVLGDVRWLLEPGGVVSVYENMYDGWPYHNAPSHLIFGATSTQRWAGAMRRLGANTAGVGVCFQSEASWRGIFEEAGLEVVSFTPDEEWQTMSRLKRAALMVRSIHCGHFWLRPAT
jgi:SAM-dependent methyltransferase